MTIILIITNLISFTWAYFSTKSLKKKNIGDIETIKKKLEEGDF